MSTIFLTQSADHILNEYNVSENFGLINEDNLSKTENSCKSIEKTIDTIFKNKKASHHGLTRILPESVVSKLTPSKGEAILAPRLPKTKIKEAWKRWKGMVDGIPVFSGEDIPPYWIISDVGNSYSGNASQFSHYDPEISNSKIFMYACAPDRGVLAVGSKCPFLIPLLAAFDRLDHKRNSYKSNKAAKFNLPYEAVSEHFRCGNRFHSISTEIQSDFASTNYKTVYVFSFTRSNPNTNGILELIANTPYGFEAANSYDHLAEGIIGYSEVTVDYDSKKAFMDFIALVDNDPSIGLRVIEDMFSTFSPELYPFTSAILGFGRGNDDMREALFANLFLRMLKFGDPGLVKSQGIFVGSEVYIVRNRYLKSKKNNISTINNLAIFVALRNLARYIDSDTCQMRDLPIKFDSEKREEFQSILQSLDCNDLAKTNFKLHNEGNQYSIETNGKHTVTYIKNYCNSCPEEIFKSRKLTVFERDPLPCDGRFTALMRNVENEPMSCKLFGDLVETTGILHEMIIYMTPEGFYFARVRKFLQLYLVFLYNLIKCSMVFVSDNCKDHLISLYKSIILSVMYKVNEFSTSENIVPSINSITISQILEKSNDIISEESVKTIKMQMETFSCMLAECGAEKDACNTKVITIAHSEW